ncbi:hypothetical protein PoMZ_01416 [Pyricularia oryzae]|uniref:Uncharacterized protein n=1 Tax=Pyricularia oryzae TaxID=318829 RepID=A0A4P7N258_PYROR|nr:hypothetical protein PoMZ_01416 [Pyricularia oryzae]
MRSGDRSGSRQARCSPSPWPVRFCFFRWDLFLFSSSPSPVLVTAPPLPWMAQDLSFIFPSEAQQARTKTSAVCR